MPTLSFFPFGKGLHQENDSRLQDAGTPRAVENLIRTKNGRLCPRRDYETIAMTGTGSNSGGTGPLSNFRLYDLAEYNGRVLGFGRADFSSKRAHLVDSTQDVFELLEVATGNWRRAPTADLCQGTEARFVGRIGRKPNSIDIVDIAAANGLVCVVFDVQTGAPSSTTASVGVHIFRASDDVTVFSTGFTGHQRPRVVQVDGVFFIGAVETATNAISLFRFDPATDTALATLTQPVAAGAAVTAWDMHLANDLSAFWIAVGRTGPTTAIRGLNSAGTVTYTAAGPAVLFDGVSIFNQTSSGTNRTHFCGVRNPGGEVDLYTYLPPATVPTLTTLDIGGASNSLSQVGMEMDADTNVSTITLVLTWRSTSQDTLLSRGVDVTSHGLTAPTAQMSFSRCNSKPLAVNSRFLIGAMVPEEVSYFTHALVRLTDTLNSSVWRPVAVTDRFLGHQLSSFHLPSLAYDTSTDLVYQVLCPEDTDRRACPQVLEIKIASTRRRQTVQLGDVLYIAGAIVMAFDGRVAQEAGGFLSRPFIDFVTASATAGALDDPGTYQVIAVQEYRDSKGRRIQSAPSNLVQQVVGGGFPTVQVGAEFSLSFRDLGLADTVTPIQMQNAPTQALYRTLNIDEGNGTFHLDQSIATPGLATKGRALITLINSDVTISANEILYTQGARGALSGPLEFVCPDGAGVLAASADRILGGQLPNETQIQESRPLFPGEQAQWNDTPGFFQDIRNRVLAVARLDERRILFTATELFECDGPGIDDNGLGELGAPRRLPSDVGIYGGNLGWRSLVEMSAGIIFQGTRTQLYLLPRGGVTPVPIGFAVEDKLDAFPVISAAVYIVEDQTVRLCCNNEAGTQCIILLFNVRFSEWFVEGPYAFTIRAATKQVDRFVILTSDNTVLRQRDSITPLAFVSNAWRSDIVHPWKPGMFGRVHALWFYGTVRGDCRIRCIVTYDERDTETHEYIDVVGRELGSQFVFKFVFEQTKCENVQVDFEIIDFQGRASRGLDYTYWAIEGESADVPNEPGPEEMT